jgi:transcriptional regulator with XRE-family HTH domain
VTAPDRDVFADWLGGRMVAQRITQAELAGRVGVSQQAVSRWLAASSYPGTVNAARLARALGLSADEVLERIE